MGRHGKNRISMPTFQALGPVDPDHMLSSYEKQLLTEAAQKDLVRKATDTCMAATAKIMIYNFDDLAECQPDERLQVYYGLLGRCINEQLDKPDEKQEFAEWYWSACTGNPLIRVGKEKEYKMAKKFTAELSKALKNKITEKGYSMTDICKACNISRGSYYNLVGSGQYSKKAYDTIAKYVGLEITGDLKNMYDQRFGIGNPQQVERMEEMAMELETKAEEKTVDTVEKVEEPKQEAPEPEKEGVPEPNTPEPEKAEDDTVPYKDANDMYREAAPEPQEAGEEEKDSGVPVNPYDLIDNIEYYGTKLPELEKAVEVMESELKRMKKFIKVVKLMQEE